MRKSRGKRIVWKWLFVFCWANFSPGASNLWLCLRRGGVGNWARGWRRGFSAPPELQAIITVGAAWGSILCGEYCAAVGLVCSLEWWALGELVILGLWDCEGSHSLLDSVVLANWWSTCKFSQVETSLSWAQTLIGLPSPCSSLYLLTRQSVNVKFHDFPEALSQAPSQPLRPSNPELMFPCQTAQGHGDGCGLLWKALLFSYYLTFLLYLCPSLTRSPRERVSFACCLTGAFLQS